MKNMLCPGMQNDGEPAAVEAFAGIRKYQVCRHVCQDAPGLMKMVQAEDNPVCKPIPFPKNTFQRFAKVCIVLFLRLFLLLTLDFSFGEQSFMNYSLSELNSFRF